MQDTRRLQLWLDSVYTMSQPPPQDVTVRESDTPQHASHHLCIYDAHARAASFTGLDFLHAVRM